MGAPRLPARPYRALPACLPRTRCEPPPVHPSPSRTPQVDYLLRRLLSMNERIDDTEDLVAIKMDHRR